MLDIEKIRDLVEMMVTNDLVEISLRDGQEEINLRRPGAALPFHPSVSLPAGPRAVPVPGGAAAPPAAPFEAREDDDVALIRIDSPMVGTFYTGPDPDSPPFVQVGSDIQPGMVICILEAMKVFNEIKAEVAGLIERILVKNGQPVEYGQTLFLVRPA